MARTELTEVADSGRRMRRRELEVTLGDVYSDFHCTLWVNPPPGLLAGLTPQSSEDDLAHVMGQVIVSHDFVDYDGRELPPADDPAFWRQCPPDLAMVVMQELRDNTGKLSKTNGVRSGSTS